MVGPSEPSAQQGLVGFPEASGAEQLHAEAGKAPGDAGCWLGAKEPGVPI